MQKAPATHIIGFIILMVACSGIIMAIVKKRKIVNT